MTASAAPARTSTALTASVAPAQTERPAALCTANTAALSAQPRALNDGSGRHLVRLSGAAAQIAGALGQLGAAAPLAPAHAA